MSNAWDRAKEAAERQAEKGGIYVRLKNNGDKVVGAFCGDPYAKDVVWTGQKYEEYDEKNPDHKGAKSGLRVALNFFVPAEGVMKVLEGSGSFFQNILKVKDKYGLEKWLFEIERQGEAGNPKTKYSILPDEKITDDVRAKMAKAKLHDLTALGKGDEDDEGGSSASGPVSEQAAQAIVEKLKALPKSDVTAFLGKFGISRVRDLKQSDLSAANELLTELTGGGAEVDPFA